MSQQQQRGFKRGHAVELLSHYFRVIAERAGVAWCHDNDAEIRSVLDPIFAELDSLHRRVNELQAHREGGGS